MQRKIAADQRRFQEMLDNKLADSIHPALAISVLQIIISNDEWINRITDVKNISADFIRFNEMARYKIITIIASIHLNDKELGNVVINDEYLKGLARRTYDALFVSDFNNLEGTSLFMSNPYISNLLNMIDMIMPEANSNNVYARILTNIFESIKSVFILFDYKCYNQAMSVFRQALEHFITLKALDLNQQALESYINHQMVTVADVLHEMSAEDLDKYIKDNNLTYNTYKSYMNYGWLDAIPAFVKAKEEKPRIKYSIKTIADITGQQEFYEAMDFASNYVHPNFIIVDVNWDMVITEVLDGCYQMVSWGLEKNIANGNSLIRCDVDFVKLYNDIMKEAILNTSKDKYCFNIK